MEPTTAIIERYRRRETSVEAALVEMYIAEVSVDVTDRSRGTTGLFYIGWPFLGCWYNHQRFERYVHVQIDLSLCGEPSSGQSCRYIFSFEGADGPEAFQFAGADLRHSYDQIKRTYIVGGVGRVAYRKNVIELASTNVLLNNQSLPRGSTQPVLAFVRSDGQLLSGYCDVSW